MFEKLFSKSVECRIFLKILKRQFLKGFNLSPFNFSSEILHFCLLRLFVLLMKNDETIIIIEDVQSRF